jgi:hypothetical protein
MKTTEYHMLIGAISAALAFAPEAVRREVGGYCIGWAGHAGGDTEYGPASMSGVAELAAGDHGTIVEFVTVASGYRGQRLCGGDLLEQVIEILTAHAEAV